ncbi:MAG: hypothetical protein ACU0DI_16460 [Paracoccaceae bacterium]
MAQEDTGNSSRPVKLLSGAIAAALFGLAGCVPAPSNPESAAVNKLARQGFELVSDGRTSDAPSVMRYSGSSSAVILCSTNGGAFTTASAVKSIKTQDGLTGKQTAQVDGRIIVDNEGGQSGLYVATVVREIRSSSGNLVARQIEMIEFKPGSTGRFKNGTICKART